MGDVETALANARRDGSGSGLATWAATGEAGHALIGMGRRESPLAREVLERLRNDPDDVVRYHAVASLRRLDGHSNG